MSVRPARVVDGEMVVPGDKSISHRALILGSLARGRSLVTNVSPAADVARTADCLRRLGAWMRTGAGGEVHFEGAGVGRTLRPPQGRLDCGNSGTTMRLLSGVLAGTRLRAALDGDESLRRRPMERVAQPLRAMGAVVETTGGGAPLMVEGRPLRGMEHVLEVASAQVKSAILLAGMSADGPTTVVEPAPTRDHTERLLRLCGIQAGDEGRPPGDAGGGARSVRLEPGELRAFELQVPADLSSAAFFLGLVAGRPGWRMRCPGVTLNPGRTGVLDVLRDMGAEVRIAGGEPAGGVEPAGDVEVRGGRLRAVSIGGALIPRCIDELPLLAVVATQAEGTTVIRDAAELQVKESDRIATVAAGLAAMGARCEARPDRLEIEGPVRLRPAELNAGGDHRLAMAWAVAGLLAEGEGASTIRGAEVVEVSYPGFFEALFRLLG